MFVQVTRLQYWKSEHDETTCEDACRDDSFRGLFALSDGAGTTLFSNVWAQVLVDQAATLPLLSNDPFEVEWWIRQAQEVYKVRASNFGTMSWNVVQKAHNEGSFATLATLRIVETHTTLERAELLITGDSCAFVEHVGSESIQSFPLTRENEFDYAPICFPSKPGLFNRYFHRGQTWPLELRSGDNVVLATDAVARWIISAGKGRYATSKDALQAVMAQTPSTWKQFILDCRSRKEMVDDDSTALLISFRSSTQQQGNYLLAGATTEHDHAARKQRRDAFQQAVQAQNKELIAIYYGDGNDMVHEGILLAPAQIQQARQVADALREVLSILRESLNSPDVVARVEPVWQKYASMLATEPCADHLRQTLARLGIPLAPLPAMPPAPVNSSSSVDSILPGEVDASFSLASIEEAVETRQLSREREKLRLEKQFLHALRVEEDELILEMHRAILQSSYASEIVFSLQDEQRISLAQQHSNLKQFVRDAVAQGDVQHMTHAYKMVQNVAIVLSEDNRKCLELANNLSNAYKSGNDDQLVAIYTDILRSPYHSFFRLSAQEQELVAQAWQRRMQQAMPLPSERDANAPTISDAWFRKVCSVKALYLRQTQQISLPSEQIERLVLEDLAHDPYIQEAIEEINKKSPRKRLNPEALLSHEFNALRSSPFFDYAMMCSAYQLSDDDVKAALLMFLRAEVFASYLHRQQMSLQEWLNVRKHEGKTGYSQVAGTQEAGGLEAPW